MKKFTFLLLSTLLTLGFSGWGQVIISQYYEGSSNNKWIEITNVGPSSVDLTSPQLYICLFANAAADNPDGVSPTNNQALSGSINAGEVILFKNSSAVLPGYASGSSSSVCNFNGDDLIILSTSNSTGAWTDRVDVIGNGTSWGQDKSFYRNADIISDNTTYTPSEWTQVTISAVDNATSNLSEYLGTHLYSSGGNQNPVISNIGQTPLYPTTTDAVQVSAEVTDGDGTITNVELHWGTSAGSLPNTINMSVLAGDVYQLDAAIPAQANNTMIYFEIYAEDNDGGMKTSTEQSYLVRDGATTTLPYFEPFNENLGDCYAFSVTGDSKTWYWQSQYGNGFASVNGYNSGVLEEDWLILPGVNMDNYTGARMLFEARYQYGYDDYNNDLKLLYSTDYPGTGDPSSYTWSELSYYKPGVSDSWEPCGDIDLSAITGEMVYFAFQYKYAPSYYRYWSIDNISIVPSCSAGMTVYLKNSQGGLLSGGSLQFQDGGWHTATEIYDGIFCVETDKADINLKMTYAQADQLVTAQTNYPYTFKTVKVSFELRKRTGALGYNFGQIYYVGFGGLLATTGESGLGLAEMELLPREYTFRMKFRGGRGDITQNVAYNPVVTWQMARMLVQINKSDGTRGLNGADIKYKGYSLEQFGITGTSENGRARKDLLPGFYKFTIKYLGGSQVVENFEVSTGDNELIIDAVATTVELLESGSNLPVDDAKVKNIGVTSNLMGYTGDSGPGIVTVDLLPITYSFEVTYNGDQDTQNGIDVTSTPWVTFYTDDLKSAEVNQLQDVSVSVFPNPFTSRTTFGFSLDKDQYINISIYDLTGKVVENLYSGLMQQGNHKVNWDGEHAQKGMYIYRITTENNTLSKAIVKQ